jgi:hypothetical protein
MKNVPQTAILLMQCGCAAWIMRCETLGASQRRESGIRR